MTRRTILYGLGITAILFILVCIGFGTAEKINLQNSDLGRHLENGAVILNGTPAEVHAVLHTNFYSYTYPNFPFINHHWGIGVLFYKIWMWFGFKGLSIFYIVMIVLTSALSLVYAYALGNLASTVCVALLFLPMLTARREVRPEAITYFLSLFFLVVLYAYKKKKIKKIWLFGLCLLQLLWVNIHIGFFFGEFIIGLFFLYEILEAKAHRDWKEIRFFFLLLGLSALTTLINPNFIRGALYPLSIFKNYGYPLFENQSVLFLESFGYYSIVFATFKITLFLTWFMTGIYVFKTKNWRFLLEPLTLITAVLSYLAFNQERHIIMFALFALPLLSLCLSKVFRFFSYKKLAIVLITASVLIIGVETVQVIKDRGMFYGIGLLSGNEDSAVFFKKVGLHGPIYNNYDNGSYLDFELYGKEKVFVDNRPEAYPDSFFTDVYIPGEESNAVWKQQDDQYHFNVIWFYRGDLTAWGKQFLNTRLNDPDWALVYLDSNSVIFIKSTPENKSVIDTYRVTLK